MPSSIAEPPAVQKSARVTKDGIAMPERAMFRLVTNVLSMKIFLCDRVS
jgi:hypothetical protein